MSGRARKRARETGGGDGARAGGKGGGAGGTSGAGRAGKRRKVGGGGRKKEKKKKGKVMHSCAVCRYTTNSMSHLEKHMRTHTGEKPYACDKCTYRAALKSHMQCKHCAPTNSSSSSSVKTPSSKAKLRRCAKPFTLFEYKEFASASDPGFLGV